jgi:hypothetical protein
MSLRLHHAINPVALTQRRLSFGKADVMATSHEHRGEDEPADFKAHPEHYEKVAHQETGGTVHYHYYRKATAPPIKKGFWFFRFGKELLEGFWLDLKQVWKVLIGKV